MLEPQFLWVGDGREIWYDEFTLYVPDRPSHEQLMANLLSHLHFEMTLTRLLASTDLNPVYPQLLSDAQELRKLSTALGRVEARPHEWHLTCGTCRDTCGTPLASAEEPSPH